MLHEIKAGDQPAASVVFGGGQQEVFQAPYITYEVECRDADGNLKWNEEFRNTVTSEGKDALLNIMFRSTTQITSTQWFCGLKGTGSAAAADTLASHAGWSEVTSSATGSATRKTITFGAPSSQATAGTMSAFACTGTVTVSGAFVCGGASAATGTTGTLYSVGNFTQGDRAVVNGDTLTVTVTLTAA